MSDFEEEARKRQAALALLGDHGDDGFESEAPAPHDGLMSTEEVFGEDDLDRADRAQRQAPDDSLAQKSVIRQGVWGDLQKIAPFARINPPSVLQGTLGGQQAVRVGHNAQVALWGGVDAETLPVTVTFAPVEQITAFTVPVVTAERRPFGVVKFGTRGFLTEAVVDICRGCQFTVNASEVSLQVGVESIPGVSVNMLLSGMLSFYPTTHVAPITRTLYFDDISLAAQPSIFIPAYARGVKLATIHPGTPASPDYTLRFYDSVGTETSDYIYPAIVVGGPAWPTGFVPIPGDAVAVQVSSTTLIPPFDDTTFRLIFELAF
jgi:hypothetical protein